MSFSSVAEKSFTGIVTSPKEIAPFQIERGMPPSLPDATDSLRLDACAAKRTHGLRLSGSFRRLCGETPPRLGKLIKLLRREPQQFEVIAHCDDLGYGQRR